MRAHFNRVPWNKGMIGFLAGELSPAWKGGISRERYSLDFRPDLKYAIRLRDQFTCQLCGRQEHEELAEFGRTLSVNHIDFDKRNSSERNLITLCLRCNSAINFDREFWGAYLLQRIATIDPSLDAVELVTSWRPKQSLESRFWAKVDRSQLGPGGCWIWKASTNRSNASGGYGRFWFGNKIESAHVASFRLNGGVLTSAKPFVLHICNIWDLYT